MENKKLPEDFKRKWVAALRSGEYKQTAGTMHDEHGYCCLGVACVIIGINPRGLVVSVKEGYSEEEISQYPSALVGTAQENHLVKLLANMNDGTECEQKSFSEIADYIEENL